MEKYSKSKIGGLYLPAALALASAAGCASQAPTREPRLEERVQSPAPVDPWSYDMVPQGTPAQPRVRAPDAPQVFSSAHMGFEYLLEGPKDAEGNDRSAGARVGVALANTGLDLVNGLPYVGLVIQDGMPRRDLAYMEGFWGFNPDGSSRDAPAPWDLLSYIFALPRIVLTHHLSRGLYFLENAAYGDARDPRYAAGIPASVIAEPFHFLDRTLLGTGNFLILGRDSNDLMTGGLSAPDGKSIYDRPGESVFRSWFKWTRTNGAAAALIYGAANGGGGSSGGGGINPNVPFIDIPIDDGIAGR